MTKMESVYSKQQSWKKEELTSLDVRETCCGSDYYLTITESRKRSLIGRIMTGTRFFIQRRF
jgi:hypothetical protein